MNLYRLDGYLGSARQKGTPITQRHKNVVKTLQSILEEFFV